MQSLKAKIENSMKSILPIKKGTRTSVNFSFRNKEKSEKCNVASFTSYLKSFKVSNKQNAYKSPSTLSKKINSSINTPKAHSKKKIKQNNFMPGTMSLKNKSPTSTPFLVEKAPILKKLNQQIERPLRSDFRFLYQIGSGGFGRVWKVQNKKSQTILAMKQISKAKVIFKKSVTSIINEKQILNDLCCPFIINMKSTFQDREYLYLVMEYLRGGDLRYHLCFYENFDQEQTSNFKVIQNSSQPVQFWVLSISTQEGSFIEIQSLKTWSFRKMDISELQTLGLRGDINRINADQTSGTPGYMSPEVICRMNHSFESDFFALGVIIYQMILGTQIQRPYLGDSRKQIRQKILAHQAKINQNDLPLGWNLNCIDFINRLLKRNKESRLGYNGIHEIKSHPWLKSINWSKMNRKQILPPFQPGVITETQQYQKQIESSAETEIDEETKMLLRTEQIQNLFKSYNSNNKKIRKL